MRRVRAFGVALGAFFGSLAVTVAAFGWLFWVRPVVHRWPGPAVRLALPLDALPGHDSIPLIVFLVAWAVAAGLLGGLLRVARVPRPAAAAILLIGVGAFVYAIEVFSYYSIQGSSKHASMVHAAHLWAVYIPAAMAGLGGGVLGAHRRR